jgi:hypothetical protein
VFPLFINQMSLWRMAGLPSMLTVAEWVLGWHTLPTVPETTPATPGSSPWQQVVMEPMLWAR